MEVVMICVETLEDALACHGKPDRGHL